MNPRGSTPTKRAETFITLEVSAIVVLFSVSKVCIMSTFNYKEKYFNVIGEPELIFLEERSF